MRWPQETNLALWSSVPHSAVGYWTSTQLRQFGLATTPPLLNTKAPQGCFFADSCWSHTGDWIPKHGETLFWSLETVNGQTTHHGESADWKATDSCESPQKTTPAPQTKKLMFGFLRRWDDGGEGELLQVLTVSRRARPGQEGSAGGVTNCPGHQAFITS